MWRVTFVTFVTFVGRMWRSRTRKYFLNLWRFLSHPSRKTALIGPAGTNFMNGKKCDDSAGTETCFSLPVPDLSLISEAWSGKAIWVKTDPYTGQSVQDKQPKPMSKWSLEPLFWNPITKSRRTLPQSQSDVHQTTEKDVPLTLIFFVSALASDKFVCPSINTCFPGWEISQFSWICVLQRVAAWAEDDVPRNLCLLQICLVTSRVSNREEEDAIK